MNQIHHMGKTKSKTKSKQVASVPSMRFAEVLDIVEHDRLQCNPAHVADIEGLAFAVTTDTSGKRQPFVTACAGFTHESLDTLYSAARKRTAEYESLQERHVRDIRDIKDKLAMLWRNGFTSLRPANIHVVGESPLTVRATLISGDDSIIYTREGSPEQLLNTVKLGLNGQIREYGGDGMYSTLADTGDEPRCPVCGSPWQLTNGMPVLHCCRCDTDWVFFTRRIIGKSYSPGPVEMCGGLPGEIRDKYASGQPVTANPKTVQALLDYVASVPGTKVIDVSYGDPSGSFDQITFIYGHDGPEEPVHLAECVDHALVKCGIRNDTLNRSPRNENMATALMIYVPKSDDVDIDSFDELLGTDDELPFTMYGLAVHEGKAKELSKSELDGVIADSDSSVATSGRLSAYCPELEHPVPICHDGSPVPPSCDKTTGYVN